MIKRVNHPNHGLCPRCNSDDVYSEFYDNENDVLYKKCDNCNLDYKVHFKIVYDYTEYEDKDN